jgi:DNA-binding winged helix-turn-helix (wHTH) protein/tetratricopeptide (TPR) repeat protein
LMSSSPQRLPTYRFGLFEVFPEDGELQRQGQRVRLQEQPFRFLLALLEQPGEIVSREAVCARLWPEDTFVEFDQSLGTAVTKLRQALGDDADNPRFVETVPKRGFRFIAPVTLVTKPGTQGVSPEEPTASPSAFPEEQARTPWKPTEAVPGHSPATNPGKLRWFRLGSAGVIIVLVAGSLATYLYRRHHAFRLAPQGTIVLADFINTTGEPVFDDALRQALEIGVKQSPLVSVLSERKSAVTLKQMGFSPEQRVEGRVALELCQRNGGVVTVQGSISSLGTTYLIGLAAIRCDSGKLIANEQVEAGRKEDVVDALGKAASRLRARLGESLPSIEKYNAPLEQATTPSLEALNAYSTALLTWDRKGDRDSLPLFQKAVELDPSFAMAFGALATVYHNLGETELARQNTSKAYELRERVTQSERSAIEARYYIYVTGEIEKADHVYEVVAEEYPESAAAWNHLGNTDAKIARYERSVEDLQKALQLDPSRATTYANLAQAYLRLNRMPEAAAVLSEAEQHNLKTDYLLQANYWVAFLQHDQGRMDRIVQESAVISGGQALMLCEQANTEAFYGRFVKAADLTESAAALMQREGDVESAANCLAQGALREAEAGGIAKARKFLQQAEKSNKTHVTTLAPLVMALDGDERAALADAENLNHEFPSGTLVQNYWLPLLHGEVELHRGHADKALIILSAAAPLESAITDEHFVNTFYPAYARGQAYLAAGDGGRAVVEFQKLIDNPGMLLNYPLAALARLGRARGYAAQHESVKAREAYREFLELWKGGDADLPLLQQAKKELQALH